MKLNSETALRRLDQATLWLTVAAAAVGIVLLVLRALVHFPFFDESIHMRHLWMISAGLKPGADFFATYPVFVYFFLAPLLKLLPDSAYVLLVFRFLSVAAFAGIGVLLFSHAKRVTGDWAAGLFPLVLLAASGNIGPFLVEFSIDHYAALAGVGAMVLFFREPSPKSVAMASALCLLSVAITPKYAFPLFFGLVGFIVSVWLSGIKAKKTALAVAAGGTAVCLLVFALSALYGISFVENVKTAHVVASRHMEQTHIQFLYSAVLKNCVRRPLLGAILVLGMAGWLFTVWRRKDLTALAGLGIIAGVVIFAFRIQVPLEQYQTPVYLSLAIFSPFAFAPLGQKLFMKISRALFVCAVLVVALAQIQPVRGEFRETGMYTRDTENPGDYMVPPALTALSGLDDTLKKIPREERVIAMWAHHPMLRRDVTGIVVDDRPSSLNVLGPEDPYRRFFDPAYLRAELQKRPPALIDTFLLERNYPLRWGSEVKEYLARNMSLYQPVPSPVLKNGFFYMRKDLLAR